MKYDPDDGVWIESLYTRIKLFVYSFETRVAELYLPYGCCVDMRGAIAMGKKLDSQVRRVNTYADYLLDISYVKEGNEWFVIDHRYMREQKAMSS